MPNVDVILATRPDHDFVVEYISAWCGVVLDAAQSFFSVVDLPGFLSCRSSVEEAISEYDPYLILLNGHGLSDVLLGQDDRVLFSRGNNSLLSGRIVYALSCSTGRVLGPDTVRKGAVSYLGYSEDFTFYITTPNPPNLLDDMLARGFCESSNEIPYTIMDGGSPEEAYARSQEKFDEWIQFWSEQDVPEAPYIISALLWDQRCQVAIPFTAAKTTTSMLLPLLAGSLILSTYHLSKGGGDSV